MPFEVSTFWSLRVHANLQGGWTHFASYFIDVTRGFCTILRSYYHKVILRDKASQIFKFTTQLLKATSDMNKRKKKVNKGGYVFLENLMHFPTYRTLNACQSENY